MEVFITRADFDSRWGVYAGGNDGNKAGEGVRGKGFREA